MSHPLRRPLVLDGPEFMTRAENFANLLGVPGFQERFFGDPAGTTAEEFGLAYVGTEVLSRSNRLTYTLLSDPEFNSWAAEFQRRVDTLLPSGDAGVAEIKAVTAQLQEEFRTSVQERLSQRNADELQSLQDVQLVAEDDIAILLIVFLVLVVVAPAAQTPETISRSTVQDLLRQLDRRRAEQIRAGQEFYGG